MNPEDFLDGIGFPLGPLSANAQPELGSWVIDGNTYPSYKKFEQIFEKFDEKHKDVGNGYLHYRNNFSYPNDIDGLYDFHRFIKACIADSRLPIRLGDFKKCWGIKYMEGDYSGIHNHTPGKQMTAVLFLTGAEKSFKYPLAGSLFTLTPGNHDINYQTFTPEPGACVIMDGNVYHGTYPATGERRTFVCDFDYEIIPGL